MLKRLAGTLGVRTDCLSRRVCQNLEGESMEPGRRQASGRIEVSKSLFCHDAYGQLVLTHAYNGNWLKALVLVFLKERHLGWSSMRGVGCSLDWQIQASVTVFSEKGLCLGIYLSL
jgi:hypothetical protein